MKKHHKIFLGSFGTVVLIFMIVITLILNGIIVKQTMENKALKEEINNLEDATNKKINELAVNVINTKTAISSDLEGMSQNLESVKTDMDYLKAEIIEDFSGIVEKAIKSTVIIRTLSSQGTGFFINESGYIVTNSHILLTSDNRTYNLIQIITSDNQIYIGELIGIDSSLDIALLKINSDYPKLELENSANVKIGEKVIAIGNPEGLTFSITNGIVSATQRQSSLGSASYIQTNAQLNKGNSGGPLINKEGKVIGINNFKLIDTEGIGFALESDKIKESVNKISQEKLNQTLIQ
jgi:S1-C subfamily serine protease